MHTFFFIFFSIMVYHKTLNTVLMLYNRTLLFTYPIYINLHLLIPNSRSIPLPALHLGNHSSVLSVCESVSVFQIGSIVLCFRCHLCDIIGFMVSVLLFLTSFTQYDNLQDNPRCCKWYYFILFVLSSIPLYIMHHIFFIHLSIDGCLGCFHVLTVVNSAAMNIEVRVSLDQSFVWIYAQKRDCRIIW